jgi:hypothetical protein
MEASIIDEEHARVTSVHVVMGWSEAPPFYALADFENALTDAFAGFLRITAEGRWYEKREVSIVYNFTSGLDEEATVGFVHHILEEHCGGLGVSWVHVETWPSTSHHVKLQPTLAAHAGAWPRGDRTRDEILRSAYK